MSVIHVLLCVISYHYCFLLRNTQTYVIITTPSRHAGTGNLLRIHNHNSTLPGSQYEGIVEVFHNGAWGTVCNTNWNYHSAFVACRTAGFNSAVRAVTNGSYYGRGNGTVWLDNVQCTGNEASFFECARNWGNVDSSCNDHTRDAAVVCSDGRQKKILCLLPSVTFLHFNIPGPPLSLPIHPYTHLHIFVISLIPQTPPPSPAHVYNLLLNFSPSSSPFSPPSSPLPSDLAIRLVGGSHSYEGRVEVYHSGQWGTVCDDYWDINDGSVVCRQLGYRGAAQVWPRAHFGRGTGQIWMDNLRCTGNETFLSECTFPGWGAHNCQHYEDAGVTCAPGEFDW